MHFIHMIMAQSAAFFRDCAEMIGFGTELYILFHKKETHIGSM